jgi:hypothetical protein
MDNIIHKKTFNSILESAMQSVEKIMQNDNNLEVQVFTRITKSTDKILEAISEQQERSKSYILRKALEMYIKEAR